jgi:hypothetical protein
MRWVLFIIILAPCYALETIICDYATGSYDCSVFSEDEGYLENVITVTESEGYSEPQIPLPDEEDEPREYAKKDFVPLIFRFW